MRVRIEKRDHRARKNGHPATATSVLFPCVAGNHGAGGGEHRSAPIRIIIIAGEGQKLRRSQSWHEEQRECECVLLGDTETGPHGTAVTAFRGLGWNDGSNIRI